MKMNLAVLLVGFTMLFSTVAIVFFQAVPTEETGGPELPEKNVVDYELTNEQKNYLMERGITVIDFFYVTEGCAGCADAKALLESLTSQFSDQVFLSEIEIGNAGYADMPNTVFSSAVGYATLSGNVTVAALTDAFCEVAYAPPIGCALSKLPSNNTG